MLSDDVLNAIYDDLTCNFGCACWNHLKSQFRMRKGTAEVRGCVRKLEPSRRHSSPEPIIRLVLVWKGSLKATGRSRQHIPQAVFPLHHTVLLISSTLAFNRPQYKSRFQKTSNNITMHTMKLLLFLVLQSLIYISSAQSDVTFQCAFVKAQYRDYRMGICSKKDVQRDPSVDEIPSLSPGQNTLAKTFSPLQ